MSFYGKVGSGLTDQTRNQTSISLGLSDFTLSDPMDRPNQITLDWVGSSTSTSDYPNHCTPLKPISYFQNKKKNKKKLKAI